MKYEIVNKNTDPILEIDEIKNYLRISHNYDDFLIRNLAQAAVEYAENFTGKMINETEIQCEIRSASTIVYLQHCPIKNIFSVHLQNEDKSEDITDLYGEVNISESVLKIKPPYTGKNLVLRYSCGYGKDIPLMLKMNLMKHICNMYEFNTDAADINNDINRSYTTYRKLKI